MTKQVRVKLLSHTANPLDVVFMAARQCYFEGWVGDSWDDELKELVNMDPKFVTDPKHKTVLVKAVLDSGHTSTVEHVNFTFAIDGISRACSHQLVRHRIASYSQQSQRYVDYSESPGIESYVVPPKIAQNEKATWIYEDMCTKVERAVSELKGLGIEAEDARFLYPNGKSTAIVVTMNCRSLLNFYNERLCACAQWEIRSLAKKMSKLCLDVLPEVFEKRMMKCDLFGYCRESRSRWCGRVPHRDDYLNVRVNEEKS